MALSIRLLNWNALLVSFRHILTNRPALLFVYLNTAGTQTNPLISHADSHTYVTVVPTQCLLAPDVRYLVCWVWECKSYTHYENSPSDTGTWSDFSAFRQKGCFQLYYGPCWAEYFLFCTCEWWWVWEGFAVASYDSSSLGYLCDCDNVSSLHITFKYGDYYWNSLDL